MPKVTVFALLGLVVLVSCAPSSQTPAAMGQATTTAARPASAADVELACAGRFNVSATESPARFTIDGSVAVMRGVIDGSTPGRVDDLIQNPAVHTIVMAYVPGSDDDESNLETSLMIRAAQVATCVPAGGEVASGGTDFFLAGRVRRLADDAFVGVHSWSDGQGLEGGDLPRNDPEHVMFLDYYRQIGIDPDFYWFTLEAAPADGMHNMTAQERQQWGMETP